MMTGKLSKTNGGFTLVETVLGVMIMSIALGACILSFSMAMRSVNTAGNQMAALHYARDWIEVLRTNSFSGLSAGSGVFTNGNLYGSYIVTNIDSNTKNITVNVWYLNRIHRGFSTNTFTTTRTSALNP
jgi:type II secretory pathway pseudopilin PulG